MTAGNLRFRPVLRPTRMLGALLRQRTALLRAGSIRVWNPAEGRFVLVAPTVHAGHVEHQPGEPAAVGPGAESIRWAGSGLGGRSAAGGAALPPSPDEPAAQAAGAKRTAGADPSGAPRGTFAVESPDPTLTHDRDVEERTGAGSLPPDGRAGGSIVRDDGRAEPRSLRAGGGDGVPGRGGANAPDDDGRRSATPVPPEAAAAPASRAGDADGGGSHRPRAGAFSNPDPPQAVRTERPEAPPGPASAAGAEAEPAGPSPTTRRGDEGSVPAWASRRSFADLLPESDRPPATGSDALDTEQPRGLPPASAASAGAPAGPTAHAADHRAPMRRADPPSVPPTTEPRTSSEGLGAAASERSDAHASPPQGPAGSLSHDRPAPAEGDERPAPADAVRPSAEAQVPRRGRGGPLRLAPGGGREGARRRGCSRGTPRHGGAARDERAPRT